MAITQKIKSPRKESTKTEPIIKSTKAPIKLKPLVYDESAINTLENLLHVRARPNTYLADTGLDGLVHGAKEITDNCTDEANRLGSAGLVEFILFNDYKRNTYQLAISDNGRGVPFGKLLKAFTVMNTSGKYNSNVYQFSAGSVGQGAKVVVALAELFRVISMQPKGLADLVVKKGIAPKDITVTKVKSDKSGTIVIYEPDSSIFTETKIFAEHGYSKLIDLLKLFNLFSDYRIIFRVYPNGISKQFWTAPAKEALSILADYSAEANVVFDNATQATDKDEYIKSYFGIMRPWAWKHRISHPLVPGSNLGYEIMAYSVKYDTSGGQLSMVNTVPMRDNDSSHVVQYIAAVKRTLATYITDDKIQQFFLKNYKLPLYLCMDVKYDGAIFTGTHKTGFKSAPFCSQYSKLLTDDFNTPECIRAMAELYELFKADIDAKYNLFVTGSIEVKNTKKLILDLAFPKKFNDCSTTNRREAELFLTEGDSANSNEGRITATQATYSLRGKPFNAITTPENTRDGINKIQSNLILQDVLKITGLKPNQETFDDLRYGKIFITTDADSHGKHIANILVGDLYLFNPRFIESGILHIVTPPLYGLKLKSQSGKKKDKIIYVRTPEDLINSLAASVYYPALEIGILSPGAFDVPRILTKSEFVEFVRIIVHVGDMLTRLSKEHAIDPIILEQLTHVSYYLTPQTMDLDHIRTTLFNDLIFYDPTNNILTMSIGRTDLIISLHAINESLYREVMPFLNKICWKQLGIVVKTKYTDVYKGDAVSIVQLYQIFQSLDELFHIERYKGLGSMDSLDRAKTCMDPDHRVCQQITTIGDASLIFKCLGRDSIHRKLLLQQ